MTLILAGTAGSAAILVGPTTIASLLILSLRILFHSLMLLQNMTECTTGVEKANECIISVTIL